MRTYWVEFPRGVWHTTKLDIRAEVGPQEHDGWHWMVSQPGRKSGYHHGDLDAAMHAALLAARSLQEQR